MATTATHASAIIPVGLVGREFSEVVGTHARARPSRASRKGGGPSNPRSTMRGVMQRVRRTGQTRRVPGSRLSRAVRRTPQQMARRTGQQRPPLKRNISDAMHETCALRCAFECLVPKSPISGSHFISIAMLGIESTLAGIATLLTIDALSSAEARMQAARAAASMWLDPMVIEALPTNLKRRLLPVIAFYVKSGGAAAPSSNPTLSRPPPDRVRVLEQTAMVLARMASSTWMVTKLEGLMQLKGRMYDQSQHDTEENESTGTLTTMSRRSDQSEDDSEEDESTGSGQSDLKSIRCGSYDQSRHDT